MTENQLVYDFLRRRNVTATPEEIVRQQFCHYLTEQLGYPEALLANEVTLNVGGVARRADTVLYHRHDGSPRMVIEYKAPTIALTEKVVQQIQSYNTIFHADYLVITNGRQMMVVEMDYDNNTARFLEAMPSYKELKMSKL